jgi:hypothetical protein
MPHRSVTRPPVDPVSFSLAGHYHKSIAFAGQHPQRGYVPLAPFLICLPFRTDIGGQLLRWASITRNSSHALPSLDLSPRQVKWFGEMSR